MPVSKITWRTRRNRQNKHIQKLQVALTRPHPTVLAMLRQHLMTAEIGVDPIYLHELTRDVRERLHKMWKADQVKWLRAHPVAA